MESTANLRPTANLRLEHDPTPLAFAAEQAFATAADDHVHVVAQDPGRRVHHVVLDAQGRPGPLHELPLAAPTGIVACASAVFVTGWTVASTAVIVRVAPDGAAVATEISATPPLHVWPRPLCIAGAPWLIWTSGDPATVHIGEARGAPHPIAFADDADQLDAVGDDRGLWLARLHGPDRRLALSRIEHGKLVIERDVEATRPTAPSLARVGGGVALSWIEAPSRVRIQRFDAGAHPDSPAAVLESSPQDGPFDGAALVGAADGAVALLAWSRAMVGDAGTVHRADGTTAHVAPRRETRLRVLAYNWRTQQLGPPHPLGLDQPVHTAAWLAGSLWVIHAGFDAVAHLSVFAPVTPSP